MISPYRVYLQNMKKLIQTIFGFNLEINHNVDANGIEEIVTLKIEIPQALQQYLGQS